MPALSAYPSAARSPSRRATPTASLLERERASQGGGVGDVGPVHDHETEPRRHHGAQVGVLALGQRGQGLLQELHLSLVGPHDPEVAQRTGPQRGRGQAFGIAQGPRQCRRPLEVGVGQLGVTRPVLGLGESDQRVAARFGCGPPELLATSRLRAKWAAASSNASSSHAPCPAARQ